MVGAVDTRHAYRKMVVLFSGPRPSPIPSSDDEDNEHTYILIRGIYQSCLRRSRVRNDLEGTLRKRGNESVLPTWLHLRFMDKYPVSREVI